MMRFVLAFFEEIFQEGKSAAEVVVPVGGYISLYLCGC